jgi:hypothetical protein
LLLKQGSWRGGSPALAGNTDGATADCDTSGSHDFKRFQLHASPFDVMLKAAVNIGPTVATPVSQGDQPTISGGGAPGPGSSAPALSTSAPSSLSVLAQQFGPPNTQQASIPGQGNDVDNNNNNIEEDNESNDSGDVSDVEMEDMPFAWAPEMHGDCVTLPGRGENDVPVGHYKDTGLSCVPHTNALQQLCMAPPQLVSFKSTSDSALKGNPSFAVSIM